jgi:hypothetical protein
MHNNGRDWVEAVKARFRELEIDSGDPKWSSWVLDRLLEQAASAPGGSLQALYAGLDAALVDGSVPLTETVAHLIQDVVVKGFTRDRSAYDGIDWGWAVEGLKQGASPARCYLFLHALPPEAVTVNARAAILRGLEGTDYEQEAQEILSEEIKSRDGVSGVTAEDCKGAGMAQGQGGIRPEKGS